VEETWRLAAIVALAIAEAAEDVAGLRAGSIHLKWPNDLVVVVGAPAAVPAPGGAAPTAPAADGEPREIRKIAGILGETDGLGTPVPRAIIGAGINVDWAATDFPADLAGTISSLREVADGRPISRDDLFDAFLGRLEALVSDLRGGRFDAAAWAARQVTTGHLVSVGGLDGSVTIARALGVDGESGALVVEVFDPEGRPEEHRILAGEVSHLRLPSASVV
jgi:biotin-(acetyl-CoA carboxylase) ligase